MHLLEYINKDFGSKGYQQRLRQEIARDLSTKEGWDLLPEFMKNEMIELQANQINQHRYHMARSTPITYTKEDHPGTGGTRWYGEKDSTGFIALDQNTGDDTAIHEIYHGVTGANKGMIDSTYDLLYNAKNKDDEHKISKPYFGDPTEVYVRKKLTEDWMREIGMWDSTSGDPYTKKMQKKIRKMIDKGDAPDFVVEFFGDGELLPGVYNENEPELNRIIPEDLAIEIMNTVAFEDEIQDDMGDGISQDAYAKYGTELPKAQGGMDTKFDMMYTVPKLNEEGHDVTYSELKGVTPTNYTLSDVGHGILDLLGLIPGAGEPFDGLNALWYAAEGDKVNAALSGAGMLPFAGWFASGAKGLNKANKYTKAITETPKWSKGVPTYKATNKAHKQAINELIDRGKYLDEIGFDAKTLRGENMVFHGQNSGRSIVEVALPGGHTQIFYKSTGGGGKAVDDMWQPIGGYDETGWFIKDGKQGYNIGDYEDFYGSQAYRDIAGSLDKHMMDQGWDMSGQVLYKKGPDGQLLYDAKGKPIATYPYRKEAGGELPKAQYNLNLDNYQSQGILGSEGQGYNPLTNITLDNNISNANFGNYSTASNVNDNMVPPEGEPFYNIQDQLYASTQNVQRSMENFEGYKADMNERLQNPSLSMLDTKTSPLSTPSLDQNLLNEGQRISDMAESRNARMENRSFVDDEGNQQIIKSF